ncbi:MAG: type IV pilus assembly protein PilM [Bacillota bacterium]|nr:type IV pilus assembly protein PilM [Bacillota bacterium]
MAKVTAGRSVGLEIDYGTVRAVEAAGTSSAPRLVTMASHPLPEGSVDEGIIIDSQQVGEALRELWSIGQVKYRKVILGVSNQGVLVRQTIIPKVKIGKEKINNVIRFQAQELLPVALDSVVMDYMITGETTVEENPAYEVLIVAARREMLSAFLEALDYANLEVADIDVSTLALMRVLPETAVSRTVAVINIANGLSNIMIYDRGRPRLARLVSIKLTGLANKMSVNLNSVLEAADHSSGDKRRIYNEWLNELITEAGSSLSYYQNQESAMNLEAIILNGRGALLGGLAGRLEEALGIPVRITNPFAGYINVSKKADKVGLEAVKYAISAGLAQRGLEGS